MSFKFSAAHSSRIKKSIKPPSLKRSASSPFSSLPRRKPISRSASKPENDDQDEYADRLEDLGLAHALATDLTLRDVAQAIMYIRSRMWSPIPESRSGMNGARIAEVLGLRKSMPPVVTMAHVQALLNSPTSVEREIAELIRGGAVRKVVVGGRGMVGEVLILVKDLEALVDASALETDLKQQFLQVLEEIPTALKFPRATFSSEDAGQLMRAGFLTSSTSSWTTTDAFSTPGEGSKGTMTSINSISRAASGSLAAVGGEGAVHAAGGSGGGVKLAPGSDFTLSLPSTGPFLKLADASRSHLLSLLGKSKFREMPETLLKQRWDGGVEDTKSVEKRARGEFAGVLPGRTRKWRALNGVRFEWVLGECVGAGLVEVFETGSVGRGVRAL